MHQVERNVPPAEGANPALKLPCVPGFLPRKHSAWIKGNRGLIGGVHNRFYLAQVTASSPRSSTMSIFSLAQFSLLARVSPRPRVCSSVPRHNRSINPSSQDIDDIPCRVICAWLATAPSAPCRNRKDHKTPEQAGPPAFSTFTDVVLLRRAYLGTAPRRMR